jgi:hypothetical protein
VVLKTDVGVCFCCELAVTTLKLYLIYSTVVTKKINTKQEEAISHHWIHGTATSLLICKLVDEKAKLRRNDHGLRNYDTILNDNNNITIIKAKSKQVK